MTDPENFLERWSRRKRDAASPVDAPPESAPPDEAASEAAPSTKQPEARRDGKPAPIQTATAEPAFDVSSLPPLDSIAATTDVRPFLAAGVPSELTRAALRRAWETDPAIRNFVGLQENDWDFNNPGSIAGFGELPPGTDLQRLVAEVFGEVDRTAGRSTDRPDAASATPEPAPIAQVSQAPAEVSGIVESQPTDEQATDQGIARPDLVQHSINDAPQNEAPLRRKHGSALPE